MKLPARLKAIFVLLSLVFAILACDIPTSDTPTPLPPPTAVPPAASPLPAASPVPAATLAPGAPTPVPPSGGGVDTLTSAEKQQLAHATVRVAMLRKKSGKLQTYATGSGTIISASGLILTNCHVASPALMGNPEEEPEQLGIEILDTEDDPPVATYFAKVVAADGTLDLAVLQIDRTLDGSPVKAASLNLPYVKLGDSGAVHIGDPVYIFGFPGIGGDTITYTSGSVAGFDRMDPIGSRAWIKTDATIAGGNSGGLAANAKAEIIGVPTRLGTSSADRMTDCRVIADTNGDGTIDDRDTCVPTGGFINAIRPINWALALIKAGQANTAYVSPYDKVAAAPTATPPPKGSALRFTLNSWTSAVDDQKCPTDLIENYPSGVEFIDAVFQFKSMSDGEKYSYRWLLDNREIAGNSPTWSTGAAGKCFSFKLNNGGSPLPDGTYTLEIFTGKDLALSGSATTTVGGAGSSQADLVTVSGKVVDANTRKGVADIYVVALKPGIDPDEWLDNGTDEEIYSVVQTDSSGKFTLPDGFERGQTYGLAVGNTKLNYRSISGSIVVKSNSPETMNLNLELTKK